MGYDAFIQFVVRNKWVLLFYFLIVLIVIFKRKSFDFQAKFIALYRTKVGLKFMDRQGQKYRAWWTLFGYIGIGVGFVSMLVISYLMIDALIKLVTIPNAAPGVSLIIPGVKIPGSPIFVPFWYGIISLFFVVLIHEASHGLVARAHKIPVKSSGIVFFGPLIGAFVEPDDKTLLKKNEIAQYSVFAAGPFSNIVLAVLIAVVMMFVIAPIQGAITHPVGFSFNEVQDNYPAQLAGIKPGMVFNSINGKPALSGDDFLAAIQYLRPNEKITLSGNSGEFEIILTEHPKIKGKGYVGIVGLTSETELKTQSAVMKTLSDILTIIQTLFQWIVVLSLGIGLANLLPLGPVDGGRMLLLALQSFTTKKKADILWKKISALTLLVLLLNLLWPAFKWFGSALGTLF